MIRIIIFLVVSFFVTNAYSSPKFDKDLKKFSKDNGFIDSKGKIYSKNEIKDKKNSILIIEINSTHQNVSTEILGCMDILATNYDSNATNDDGSCNYDTDNSNATNENNQTQTIYGCMDIDAINFNNEATNNDSSCKYKENEEANIAQSSDEDNSLSYYIRTALFLGIIAAGLILIFMNRKN